MLGTTMLNRPLALLPSYALAPYDDARPNTPDLLAGIAVIPVMGCLGDAGYGWGQSYSDIGRSFMAAMAADDVGAIALLIDSPGGAVAGCFDLADLIYEARGGKPIVAILSENAYSAAYALASAADAVTVPRTGGTGSVGIITMHADLSGMLDQAGIKVTLVTYGARKADGNAFEPLADDAQARVQADVDQLGELFVDTVARNRRMKASVVKATEAGTFTGAAGVEVGFADEVLSPREAFMALANRLKGK